jgi:hypothetical protein
LTAIETRFPISQERGHVKLSFPWFDAFRPSKKTSQANIHFEKAAILFNIASVTSQQALQVERGTSDGCKQVGANRQGSLHTLGSRPRQPSSSAAAVASAQCGVPGCLCVGGLGVFAGNRWQQHRC